MTIAAKLGTEYESIRAQARVKSILVNLGDAQCSLKIRIPVKREMDSIMARVATPDPEKVTTIYDGLAAPLLETVRTADDGFMDALNADGEKLKVTDNDVLVNGQSVRSIASMQAAWQIQVEEYFKLIVTPTGEPVTEGFAEISDEFPDEAIREIVNKIDQAIRPTYGDSKKN